MRTIALVLLLGMTPIVGLAEQVQATAKKAASPTTGKVAVSKAAPPAASDSQIQAAIQGKFAKSKIARNNFQVSVRGGVATLTGTTEVVQHKGTATRLAKSAGARAVQNEIRVSEAGRAKAAAGLRRAVVKRPEN